MSDTENWRHYAMKVEADNTRLTARVAKLEAALKKIEAVGCGPTEGHDWHIDGVYVGRIARAALKVEAE